MKGNRHKRYPFTRPTRVEANDEGEREMDGHTQRQSLRDGTAGVKGYVSWGQSQRLLWSKSSHQIQILCRRQCLLLAQSKGAAVFLKIL